MKRPCAGIGGAYSRISGLQGFRAQDLLKIIYGAAVDKRLQKCSTALEERQPIAGTGSGAHSAIVGASASSMDDLRGEVLRRPHK